MFSLAYLCTSSLMTLEEANIGVLVKEQDVLVKEFVMIQTYPFTSICSNMDCSTRSRL